MGERRLFVGNLPKDSSENEIKELFKKYSSSKVELKRKKVLDEESVFAFVNVPSKNVDKCLNELNNKKWKTNSLKIEVAKESFLDRLKKEHAEKKKPVNEDVNGKLSSSFELKQNFNMVGKNKKIIFSDNEISNHEAPDSNSPGKSELDVPRRRNLPMFCGTGSVLRSASSEDAEAKGTEFSVTKSSVNSLSSVKHAGTAMKKFEEFSDVWKDDEPEAENFSGGRNAVQRQIVFKKPVKRTNSDTLNVNLKKSKGIDDGNVENTVKTKIDAESKRVTALKEKWNTITEKKNTISNALKNLDSNHTAKKIKFSESDDEKYENCIPQTNVKKITLFDQDSDEDDFQPSFDSKPHFDGKKGQKLLDMKLKFSNDERFKLSEKFLEDDSALVEDKQIKYDRFNQLSDGNGQNCSMLQRQLTRYDPTRTDHKVIEKGLESSTRNEKKKKTKKKLNKPKSENVTSKYPEPLPVSVSKDKHYTVAENLSDVFKKEEQSQFSLSALFSSRIEEENIFVRNDSSNIAEPLKSYKIDDPFQNLSDSEEDDQLEDRDRSLPESNETPSEKFLGQCGVWGETFFFKTNDSRLTEAVNFYRPEQQKKKTIDFTKQRRQLKCIVRKKLQHTKQDNKLFKKKLGGKINKQKFKMRLKRVKL